MNYLRDDDDNPTRADYERVCRERDEAQRQMIDANTYWEKRCEQLEDERDEARAALHRLKKAVLQAPLAVLLETALDLESAAIAQLGSAAITSVDTPG